MSIAEAFSVGTPVVCSDLGNSGDLVVEGVNGAKFHANSPDELVSAINRLVTYENIYESTLSEYEMKYTKDKNYSDLACIYSRVM
jgi:glycosyltransferase involved in cell wall biosynthesis